MKKIGLVTLYNSDNYGALLQAYALQTTIRNLGCECEIVQHDRFGGGIDHSRKTRRDKLNNIIQYLSLFLRNPRILSYSWRAWDQGLKREFKRNRARCREFRRDFFPALSPVFYNSIGQIQDDPPRCDAFVCGSDQIWNPSRFEGSAPFFLDFGSDDVGRIAYAPSLANDRIPESMRPQYKEWIERFQAVSVREPSSCAAVEEATGIKPRWVLDPTFLLDREEWAAFAEEDPNRRRKFVFCYFLGYENFIAAYGTIRKVAKRLDADIVVLPNGLHTLAKGLGPEDQLCGPRAFLGYIKNAAYVLTDSFHGTALSINFRKDFGVFRARANASFIHKFVRMQDILDALGLGGRTFSQGEIPPLEPVDYASAAPKLDALVRESKTFLADALSAVRELPRTHPGPDIAAPPSCSGCSACVAVCPVGALKMEKNAAGFWHPDLDRDTCVGCGACTKACPVRTPPERPAFQPHHFALYAKDKALRAAGSSGNAFGVFAGRCLASQNGVVYGSAMDKDLYGASCRSTDEVPLSALQKSKYFDSRMGDAIARIKKDVAAGKNVLFCGTPCQAAAVRSVLGSPENLLLCDFICHGVPSADWFKRYLLQQERRFCSRAVKVDFRSKAMGWLPKLMEIRFENGRVYRRTNLGDPFLVDFDQNNHLNEVCYNCNRILRSAADLSIGDYWESKKKKQLEDTNEGISVVRINTPRGERFFDELRSRTDLFMAELSDADVDETFVLRCRKPPKNHDVYPNEFPMQPKLNWYGKLLFIYFDVYLRKLVHRL